MWWGLRYIPFPKPKMNPHFVLYTTVGRTSFLRSQTSRWNKGIVDSPEDGPQDHFLKLVESQPQAPP